MRRSLVLVLALLISVPAILSLVLGFRGALDEANMVELRQSAAYSFVLESIEKQLTAVTQLWQDSLDSFLQSIPDQTVETWTQSQIDTLRERVRSSARIQQFFIIEENGELLYPRQSDASNYELAFINRWQELGQRFNADQGTSENSLSINGWFLWHWKDGEQLFRWIRGKDDLIFGIELDMAAFYADLIIPLVAANPIDQSQGQAIRLFTSDGLEFYRWGRIPDDIPPSLTTDPASEIKDTPPRVAQSLSDTMLRTISRRNLNTPLKAWYLDYQITPAYTAKTTSLLPWVFGLVALSLGITLGLWAIIREIGRELRLARQRQSFVNQVSHELKTPLTNIRLYAELLETVLSQEQSVITLNTKESSVPKPTRLNTKGRLTESKQSGLLAQIEHRSGRALDYTRIINTEAQRLSRLISNVLSFAAHERKKTPKLHPEEHDLIEVCYDVVQSFAPGFEKRGIKVEFDFPDDFIGNSTRHSTTGKQEHRFQDEYSNSSQKLRCSFDRDLFEQVLGNLLSNVEKYASEAGWVEVSLRYDASDQRIDLRVNDNGPGVPPDAAERIFKPFERLHQKTSDGAGGAGLGLTISRELARLHGGDLRLEQKNGAMGACFYASFKCLGGGTQ